MGVEDDCNFSFEPQIGNPLNWPFSSMISAQQPEEVTSMTMSSMYACKEVSSSVSTPCSSANVAEEFYVTDWKPLVLVDQNVDISGSSGLSSYNVKVPQGNNGSNAVDSNFINKHGIEKNFKGKKRNSMLESVELHPNSLLDRVQQKNVSPESASPEKDEKKHKRENPGGITHKPSAKHAKDHSRDLDAPSENYIHVRSKQGQATNSHSLAERMRRERISERMRLLQDLVPGCSKITGKAMMLDEIINYVQSLQRQVEFLSMKLAAVNPELHFDIEQNLVKDILHSRDRSLAAFGCVPGMSTSPPHFCGSSPQIIMQPEMVMSNVHNSGDMMRFTVPQVSPMAQLPSVWDDELQTVLQMGFIPNSPLVSSDPEGSMKMEQ